MHSIKRKPHVCIVAYATLGVGTGLRLDADVVVHSSANTLLASEVSFRRLDRNVSEQKLDLFQFSARGMTELREGTPQIMWRHLRQTEGFRILLYHVPNHSLRNAVTPSFACPTNASEQPPVEMPAEETHRSIAVFTHSGTGTVRIWPPFRMRSTIAQCSSRC